jgi:hypothetical protein
VASADHAQPDSYQKTERHSALAGASHTASYAMLVASDDAIVELGSKLNGLISELSDATNWVDEVAELFNDQVERTGTWPADQREWTYFDAKTYWEARCRVEKTTEIGAAFKRAHNAEDAIWSKVDPLWGEIKRLKAHTARGRLIKRWARNVVLANSIVPLPLD